jgi:cytochrome b
MRVPEMSMTGKSVRVWDPFVRIFHWSLVLSMTANAFFTEGDGAIHQWIGYVVAALIVARIVWGFVGTAHARFSSFPPSLHASMDQLADISVGRRKIHIGHTPLGAFMIYNLLLTVLVICASGYLMTTDAFWGAEWTEDLHKGAVTWMEISAVVHVIAVMFESVRTKVNLPRAMITGYKHLP